MKSIKVQKLFFILVLNIISLGQLCADYAESEELLSDKANLKKAVLLYKAHDKPLLIKLYYEDASGNAYTSLFKPKRSGAFPLAPEYGFYSMVRALGGKALLKTAPMIPFSLTRSEVERLAADKSDTPVDEKQELLNALAGRAANTATPSYSTNDAGEQILVGSNTLWVNDLKVDSRDRTDWKSSVSRLDSTRSPDKAIIQLLLLDYIAANNDRAGNLMISRDNSTVWSIDNDDSFIAASIKRFCADMFAGISNTDSDYLEGLENLKDLLSTEQGAAQVFRFYSSNDQKKYAQQSIQRINAVLGKY